MMMSTTCGCKADSHPHHAGTNCDRPAVSPAEEIEEGTPDTSLGAICLECYQLLAVEAHEADPTAVVDLNIEPSFPMCESPALA